MATRQELKNNLLASLGLGPNMRRTAMDPLGASSPNVMDPFGISSPALQGFNFRRGVMPSDTEINRYLDSLAPQRPLRFNGQRPAPMVGNRAGFGRQADGAAEAARMAQEDGAKPGTSLFDQLVASYKSKIDEANAANIKRYDEIHKELSDLRTRNQDRVKNWGFAAQADIDERMQTALGNQRAELAARGLSNSSILPAFEGQVAQRTAREQQRVSEMRDSRASEYDSKDTNALVGAVERREDVAPDYNNLIQLAMQYGRSGQGQGMDALKEEIAGLKRQVANKGRYRPMTQLPMMPGPVGGAPIFLNSGSMGFPTPGIPSIGATTSNRYPTPRGGGGAPQSEQEAYLAYMNGEQFNGPTGLTPAQSRVMRERQAKTARLKERQAQRAVLDRMKSLKPVHVGQPFMPHSTARQQNDPFLTRYDWQ